MAATFATNGATDAHQPGNDTGAMSTGLGLAANQSGVTVPGNFTSAATDVLIPHLGNGPITGLGSSDANLGQIMVGFTTLTPGSGYTNGTYDLPTSGGGAGAVQGIVRVVVAAGAIASAVIQSAGGKFTAAPSVSLAPLGAGTLGAVVPAIGFSSPAYALGTGWGASKSMQRLTATGAVAIGAAVTPSTYLNRSGRAMVAGESVYAVAP